MSVLTSPVIFAVMAKKDSGARTDQINFRLKTTTIEQMEAYKDRHPLHPTLTQIVEAALKQWLAENEKALPPKPK